jgi:uncharacterized protein with PQ loop repeat
MKRTLCSSHDTFAVDETIHIRCFSCKEYTLDISRIMTVAKKLAVLTSVYSSVHTMDPARTLPLVVSIIGTISSCAMQLSPIPVMIRIRKSRDVGFYRPDPFIIGVCFGLVNGTYSIYSNQLVSAISTGIGLILYSIYLILFVYYSKSKHPILKRTCIFVGLSVFLTAIGPVVFILVNRSSSGEQWFTEHGGLDKFISTWLGVCATLSVVLLFSGQLTNLVEVVKKKDARSISLSMALGGLFCSIAWAVYASLILDPFYMTANGIGVVSGIVQLTLKKKFKEKPTVVSDSDSTELPTSPEHGEIEIVNQP